MEKTVMEEMDEMDALRTRLARLERAQARLKRTVAGALLVAAGLASAAAAAGPAPIVDAREFRVIGADGKVRATLGPSEQRWGGVDDGQFGTATTALKLYDDRQLPHVILASAWEPSASDPVEGGSLFLSGRRDGPVVSIGTDHSASVILQGGADGNWVALGGGAGGMYHYGLTVRTGQTRGSEILQGGGAGFEAADGKITFFDHTGRPTTTLPQGSSSDDSAELTRLLREFLAGASRNDPAVHDRFWADELVYTDSSGRRIGKADILSDVRAASSAPGAGPTTYTAEDIRIQQHGDTAVVAFRLVGTIQSAGKPQATPYFNTGTFLRRKGEWRAVAWQATRTPRLERDARSEIGAAQWAIDRAILAADVKGLEPLLDETFVWTHPTGEQGTRKELLDDLAAGTLHFMLLEQGKTTVSLYGDTAVARGQTRRQSRASPGAPPGGDPEPYTSFYTTTFVNRDGVWKAVALHTSRAR
jgi:ketosteroid isomerase-like protein